MTDVTDLFEREYERLVRSLGVAFGAESLPTRCKGRSSRPTAVG
jgi:hypothetical protein